MEGKLLNAAASKEWYYIKNKNRCGPYTTDEMMTLIKSGDLNRASLICNTEIDSWVEAGRFKVFSELFEFYHRKNADEFLVKFPPKHHDTEKEFTKAGPFRRYIARMADEIALSHFLFSALSYASIILINENIFLILIKASPIWILLSGIIIMYITGITLALINAVFDTTPGKAAFGVYVRKITDEGRFRFYVRRELRIMKYAFAFGTPIISLFTMYFNYKLVKDGRNTNYDEGQAIVENRQQSFSAHISGIALIVSLIFVSIKAQEWG